MLFKSVFLNPDHTLEAPGETLFVHLFHYQSPSYSQRFAFNFYKVGLKHQCSFKSSPDDFKVQPGFLKATRIHF